MVPHLIYTSGVLNQEYAPLELKNEMLVTVGKSGSLSGQPLWPVTTGWENFQTSTEQEEGDKLVEGWTFIRLPRVIVGTVLGDDQVSLQQTREDIPVCQVVRFIRDLSTCSLTIKMNKEVSTMPFCSNYRNMLNALPHSPPERATSI